MARHVRLCGVSSDEASGTNTRQVRIPASARGLPSAQMIPPFLVWAFLCFIGAASLAYAVLTNWDSLLESDQVISESLFELAREHSVVANLAWIWHILGTAPVLMPIVIVVVLALCALRHWGFALFLVGTSMGGVLIAEVVKHAVERQRPDWSDPLLTESGFSFPSGHAMAGIYAWAVFGIIALYLIRGRLGAILGWALIIFGILMGPSRIFLGVHWTSDVVAGWLLAVGWVLVVSSVAIWLSTRRQSRRQADYPVPTNELGGWNDGRVGRHRNAGQL